MLAGSYDRLLTPDMLKSTVLTQIEGARMIAQPCGLEIPPPFPPPHVTCERKPMSDERDCDPLAKKLQGLSDLSVLTVPTNAGKD